MRACSGGLRVEVRDAADVDVAVGGLRAARGAIFAIAHPEQPDEPFASVISGVHSGARGPWLELDMADAEAYDDILEETLARIVACLDEAGLEGGCVTWPEGLCERSEVWRPGARRSWLDIGAVSDDPSPPAQGIPAPGGGGGALGGGWWACSPVPTPRSRMSVTVGPDGRLYCIGGEGRVVVKTVEAYDPASDSWSRVASLGIARRGPGAVLGPDGRIYAIGGYDSQRQGVTTVEAYDPQTQRWEQVAPLQSRYARNEIGAACGTDGRIYAAAVGLGSLKDFSPVPNTLEAYDTTTDTWTPLRPPPGRYGQRISTVAAADGRIYVIGAPYNRGDPATIKAHPVIVEAYDPRTDHWQTLASPTRRRDGFGATPGPDGGIYLLGGGPSRFDLEPLVEAYDPHTDRWHQEQLLPTPRSWPAVTTAPDGRIYVIGGYNETDVLAQVEAHMPNY